MAADEAISNKCAKMGTKEGTWVDKEYKHYFKHKFLNLISSPQTGYVYGHSRADTLKKEKKKRRRK